MSRAHHSQDHPGRPVRVERRLPLAADLLVEVPQAEAGEEDLHNAANEEEHEQPLVCGERTTAGARQSRGRLSWTGVGWRSCLIRHRFLLLFQRGRSVARAT
jgi:hypothetical protein